MHQTLSQEEALQVLARADCGTLSMVTPEGLPYGVMIHHIYVPRENCFFFHCANRGEKLTCLRANPKVSFFAASNHTIVPACYTTRYDSVIVSGTAEIVADDGEKRHKLELLCQRFSPEEPRHEAVIEKYWNGVTICKIHIDSITGKRNTGS